MSKKRIRAKRTTDWKHSEGMRFAVGEIWTLPATVEAYEQMIKQAVNDLANADANDRCSYDEMVRAVAASWGITPPKKGRA